MVDPTISGLVEAFQAKRISRRQLFQGAAAAGISASALATMVSLTPTPAAAQAGGALQIGRELEFAPMFLPLHTSNGTQTQLFDLIYSRLLKLDSDLTLVPDAAESFEVSDDATIFTFKIRPGMTWQDGEPFTIDDIMFSYTLALNPEAGAGQAGKLRQIKGAQAYWDGTSTEIPGLERVDDATLRITLEKPNVAFLIGTALSNSLMWILPEHIYKDIAPADLETAPATQNPTVGSGPYQFVEYVADQHLAFKANPNFYLGAPKIEQVFIRLAEAATQLAQLESGELHLMSRMAPKEADRLSTSDILTIASMPGNGVFQTAINNERFTDKRVRQAMMYGVDRKALLDVVLLGQGELVHSTVIGPEWATYDDLNTYEFDPEKAKALLAEAGWDADQNVQLTWPKGTQTIELAAPVFQQQMAEIGLKIELVPQETAAYISAVVDEPDFDMAWFGGGSYRLDPDVSSTYYACANFTPGGGNTTHFCSEELDALLLEGRGTPDIEQRTAIYHDVAKILNEEIPTIFWWSDNQIFGISNQLQGVTPGPNQYIWWNINEWSLT